MAYFSYN